MKKIYPFEVVTAATIIICVITGFSSAIPIIPFRPWSINHFTFYLSKIFLFIIIILTLKGIYLKLIKKNDQENLLTKKIIWENFFLTLRFLICLELIFTSYTTIKQAIPFINPNIYDQQLLIIDRFIHFGIFPSTFIAETANLKIFNKLLDKLYFLWFPTKILVLSFFIIHTSKIKKQLFLSSYFMIWVIGVFLGLALPSIGPFALEQVALPAPGMDFSFATQKILSYIYEAKKPITANGNGNMFFGYGLMAFPSLHVTACILFFYFLKDENEILKYSSLIFLILIFLGSLYSGWHYAVDGYAGILIVFISVTISKYLVYSKKFKI
jgi:hypothetical protein